MNTLIKIIKQLFGKKIPNAPSLSSPTGGETDAINKIQCKTDNEEIKIDNTTNDSVATFEMTGEGSVLDNIPCQTMIECCCQILDYLEQHESYGNANITEAHSFIEQIIFEYIVRIGGELIKEDTEFQPLRHKPAKNMFITPGTQIGTVTPGVILDGKVLIKAKVKTVE